MMTTLDLYKKYNIQLKMKRKYTRQSQQYNYSYIMDDILLAVSSKCEFQKINACRIFLDITFL